jgi:hypothetical protein
MDGILTSPAPPTNAELGLKSPSPRRVLAGILLTGVANTGGVGDGVNSATAMASPTALTGRQGAFHEDDLREVDV